MQKQEVTFSVSEQDGVITYIEKSSFTHPPIRYQGGKMKWFDDMQLVKEKERSMIPSE